MSTYNVSLHEERKERKFVKSRSGEQIFPTVRLTCQPHRVAWDCPASEGGNFHPKVHLLHASQLDMCTRFSDDGGGGCGGGAAIG